MSLAKIGEKKSLTYSFYCCCSQLDDSEASVTRDFVGFYDIVVFRVVDHADIPRKSTFSCELTIPGTDYRVREQAVYQHNTHGGESTNI